MENLQNNYTFVRELKTRGINERSRKKTNKKKNKKTSRKRREEKRNLLSKRPAKCDSTIIFANAFRKFHKRKIVDFFNINFHSFAGRQPKFICRNSRVIASTNGNQRCTEIMVQCFCYPAVLCNEFKRVFFFCILALGMKLHQKKNAWI